MASALTVSVSCKDTLDLLECLQQPINFNSLPNIIQFFQFVGNKNGLCFAGPAICGKTTLIHNLHLGLIAREIQTELGNADWLSVLAGERTLTVKTTSNDTKYSLRYMPLDEPKEPHLELLPELSNRAIIFHFEFGRADNLSVIQDVIETESLRAAHSVARREKIAQTPQDWAFLENRIKGEYTSSVRYVLESFPILEKRNVRLYSFGSIIYITSAFI